MLHAYQVNSMRKIKLIYNLPTYIKLGENLVRTVVSLIDMSPGNL